MSIFPCQLTGIASSCVTTCLHCVMEWSVHLNQVRSNLRDLACSMISIYPYIISHSWKRKKPHQTCRIHRHQQYLAFWSLAFDMVIIWSVFLLYYSKIFLYLSSAMLKSKTYRFQIKVSLVLAKMDIDQKN